MKLYYLPVKELSAEKRSIISHYCFNNLITWSVELVRGELCYIYIISTSQSDEIMSKCPYIENFSVLHIDNVLELFDFKKENKNEN